MTDFRSVLSSRHAGSLPLTVALLAMALAAAPALAIHPGRWQHTTEADFQPGETENTVVTNLGDVKLANHTEVLEATFEGASIIYDLQVVADGTLYIAAGPEAKLFRRTQGRIEQVLELKDEQMFCLDLTADGRLLVCVSGDASRLAVLEGDELKDLIALPGVRYIWDVLVDEQVVFAATGTEGQLLRVDIAEGAQTPVGVLLDTEQANVLCLGRDGQGRIYAGTDKDGLLYRVTLLPGAVEVNAAPEPAEAAGADEAAEPDAPAGPDEAAEPDAPAGPDEASEADEAAGAELPKIRVGQVFVVYDTAEPEIGALLVAADGTIYIGTADAQHAKPGRLVKPVSTQNGRPKPAPPAEAKSTDQPAEPQPAPADQEAAPAEAAPPAEPAEPDAKPDDQAKEPSQDAGVEPVDKAEPVEPAATEPKDAEAAPADAVEPKPDPVATPEQRDELREVMRERLEEARASGAMQAGPPAGRGPQPSGPPRVVRAKPPRPGAKPRKNGNAVYRITPRGFVNEVFRESVMILRLLDDDGKLLIATGNEGQVFSLDVAAQETAMLVDLKASQIPAMVHGPEGEILLGTANGADLVRLGRGYAEKGLYTSPVMDAAQISFWGRFAVTAKVPKGTALAVRTRTGNVADPEDGPWSDWSEPAALEPDPEGSPLAPLFVKIASESARFLQYRLELAGSAEATPQVDSIQIAYVVPNLRPSIASIKASYVGQAAKPAGGRPGAGGRSGKAGQLPPRATKLKLEWVAADANKDRLQYKLEYELAGSGMWLTLEDELDQKHYEWDTLRTPNGRYTVRVTATDAADNSAGSAMTATRMSNPILIDNAAPAIGTIHMEPENAIVVITTTVEDVLSPVAGVHYSVDDESQWLMALPDDLIYDSTSESITIKIPDLAPGRHVVTLRAVDGCGNAVYQALFVDVKQAE